MSAGDVNPFRVRRKYLIIGFIVACFVVGFVKRVFADEWNANGYCVSDSPRCVHTGSCDSNWNLIPFYCYSGNSQPGSGGPVCTDWYLGRITCLDDVGCGMMPVVWAGVVSADLPGNARRFTVNWGFTDFCGYDVPKPVGARVCVTMYGIDNLGNSYFVPYPVGTLPNSYCDEPVFSFLLESSHGENCRSSCTGGDGGPQSCSVHEDYYFMMNVSGCLFSYANENGDYVIGSYSVPCDVKNITESRGLWFSPTSGTSINGYEYRGSGYEEFRQ